MVDEFDDVFFSDSLSRLHDARVPLWLTLIVQNILPGVMNSEVAFVGHVTLALPSAAAPQILSNPIIWVRLFWCRH